MSISLTKAKYSEKRSASLFVQSGILLTRVRRIWMVLLKKKNPQILPCTVLIHSPVLMGRLIALYTAEYYYFYFFPATLMMPVCFLKVVLITFVLLNEKISIQVEC